MIVDIAFVAALTYYLGKDNFRLGLLVGTMLMMASVFAGVFHA